MYIKKLFSIASLFTLALTFQNCAGVGDSAINPLAETDVLNPDPFIPPSDHVLKNPQETVETVEPIREAASNLANLKKGYALVNTIIVTKKNGDTSLSTSYRSVLSKNLNVKNGDIVLIHAIAQGTHESPPGINSVSDFHSYIGVNGLRRSPYRSKTLKRARGNHHGAVRNSAVYHIPKNMKKINVSLFAKTSRPKGLLHYGQQTRMIINQYRLSNVVKNSKSKWLSNMFSSQSKIRNFYFQRNSDPYGEKYLVDHSRLNVSKGDYLYTYAQGAVDRPNKEIPMFGFGLFYNGKVAALATENPTPYELFRISQFIVDGWTAKKDETVNVETKFYGLESKGIPRMRALTNQSSMLGLHFRSDLDGQAGYGLKKARMLKSTKVISISANSEERSILPTTESRFSLSTESIVRISGFTTLDYLGSDVRSCSTRLELFRKNSLDKYYKYKISKSSSRHLKAPYRKHNFSNELITSLAPGEYSFKSTVRCSKRSDKTLVKTFPKGTSVLLSIFEKI